MTWDSAPEGAIKNENEFRRLIGRHIYSVCPLRPSWDLKKHRLVYVGKKEMSWYYYIDVADPFDTWYLTEGTGSAPFGNENGYFFTNYFFAYGYWRRCRAEDGEDLV